MKERAGRIGFGAVTIFLILVTAFCCVGTVLSRTNLSARELESCYRAMEKQLVCGTGKILNEKGFQNSGIMLTHVTEEDGSRQYFLSVHHAGIRKLCGEDRQKLLAELEGFVLEEGRGFNCIVFFND